MKHIPMMIRSAVLAVAMCVSVSTVAMAQPGEVHAGFADLVEKLSPAVVNISTSQKVKAAQGYFGMPFESLPNTPEFEPFREFFDRFGQMQKNQPEREVFSLGSGFIIDPKGYVITNNHVVAEADEVTITLSDNTKYKADIIGRDPKTDLALLKIDPKKDLPYVPLGDSDKMRVGDWVIAIGNPFGLGGSVTQGIISARQRSINAGPFDDFLQTDAPINRGNSGGPLFNTSGEVIGITSAIFSPSGGSVGIGFAIPTALAKPVIEQLKSQGHVTRGWLGVKIQEVSDEIAESLGLKKNAGALVMEVGKDSPAEKAGIKQGDIITSFDGKDVTEMRYLPRMVAESKIGSTVKVEYWRNNASHTAMVTIGKLDEDEAVAKGKKPSEKKESAPVPDAEKLLGMDLIPMNAAIRQNLHLPADANGVVVTDVETGSEAAKRGIMPGDVIASVNNVTVKTPGDIRKLFEAARKQGRNFALVQINRENEMAFITLPTAEK